MLSKIFIFIQRGCCLLLVFLQLIAITLVRLLDFFFFFFLHVLCLFATLWVMTDLSPVLYVHFYISARPDAPYFITVSAFSRRNLLAAFGLPLLSPSLSFYCLASKLIFPFLITPPLPFQLPLPCSLSAANLRNF